MPRKRKSTSKSLSPSEKQESKHAKKRITTRLIQISMKLEDYVYNNKPISVADAAMFIEEITGFKSHCLRDAPSLQVIEKLTGCMNHIIFEQTDQNCNIHNKNSDVTSHGAQTYCPSPVYSLPDEDKTQFAQDNAVDALDLNNIDDCKKAEVIETIDLCTAKDDPRLHQVRLDSSTDVGMHRAISNLSIRNIEDSLQLTPVECSQSILNNFEYYNSVDVLNEPSNIAYGQGSQRSGKNDKIMYHQFNAPTKQSEVKAVPNNGHITKTKIPVTQEINKKRDTFEICVVNNIDINATDKAGQTKRAKRHRKTKLIDKHDKPMKKTTRREKNTPKIKGPDKNNSTNKNTQNKVIRRKNITQDEKNKVTNENKTANNKTRATFPKIDLTIPPNISHEPNNDIIKTNLLPKTTYIHKESTNIGSHDNPDADKPIIYNKMAKSDLSWLENIRFVREITADEYDPTMTGLEDGFWDNFDLPQNWDDKEFGQY